MKTIKEIANDCGLDGLRPTTLANILDGTYTGSTLYEESLYVIIAGQHRRIEKLEAEKAAAVGTMSWELRYLGRRWAGPFESQDAAREALRNDGDTARRATK